MITNFRTLRTVTDRSDDFLFLYIPQKSRTAQAVALSMASKRKEASPEVRSIGRRAVGGATMASASRWHHWPLWKRSSSQGAKSLEPIHSQGDSGVGTGALKPAGRVSEATPQLSSLTPAFVPSCARPEERVPWC